MCRAALLCLWLLALLPVAAQAQQPSAGTAAGPHIRQLRVQVMPEFDDPRVLVVVQGRLEAPGDFPVQVTFRLPREAQINQMAVMSMEAEGAIPQAYDAQPDPADDRWQLVTYPLDNGHFFFEFYYDPIRGQVDKEFDFVWSSLYPVDDLLLEVQQPARASGFRLSPPAAANRLDSFLNLTYHQVQVGALAAGQEAGVAVAYSKADPDPSISWQQVMAARDEQPAHDAQTAARPAPAVAAPPSTTGSSMASQILAILGASGLALLVMGLAYAARGRLSTRAADQPNDPDLCPDCSTVLRPDATFCHYCGSRVYSSFHPRHTAGGKANGPQRGEPDEHRTRSQVEVRL